VDAAIPDDKTCRVDALACEGCAACHYQCPAEAIQMVQQRAGQWFRCHTRFGPLFHAHLFAGQENSGKLVTLVKQQARAGSRDCGGPTAGRWAAGDRLSGHRRQRGSRPGASRGRPTISGAHDLERVMATTDHFGMPSLVVTSKADLNPTRSDEIVAFCAERGVEVAGHIPYDTAVTEAMVHGQPATAYVDGPLTETLERLWQRVRDRIFFLVEDT
jgi:MinD superfamily P-loop ATPase